MPMLWIAAAASLAFFGSKPPPPNPPPPASAMELLVKFVPLLQGWDALSIGSAAAFLCVLLLVGAALGRESETATKSWPDDMHVNHACPGGVRAASSFGARLSGCLAASIFTCVYIAVPILVFAIPILIVVAPSWWVTWTLAGPFLLSALSPPMPSRSFLQAWPFRHMPAYFNFSEIREISDAEVQKLIEERPVIFSIQPHGVFSFGGASAGVEWANRWWHPKQIPTSVASSVLHTPLVKHVVGLFGVVDASTKSLTSWLSKGKSVVLYIGGIAELFLVSQDEEKLFAAKRKGFIKLALRTGSEVVPVYFMGNTSVLSVLTGDVLRKVARMTGVTLTWFWGYKGTLIPRPNKILGVLGRPLGIPKEPIAEPTQEQIDAFHKKYLEEVRRLFDSYKQYNPDYAHKELSFE